MLNTVIAWVLAITMGCVLFGVMFIAPWTKPYPDPAWAGALLLGLTSCVITSVVMVFNTGEYSDNLINIWFFASWAYIVYLGIVRWTQHLILHRN